MSPIGQIAERESGRQALGRARANAALIPDLLVEAHRVANNIFAGWHGRRKRGIGEDFWQFRPYVVGENMSAIDWRRSARDDHIYVRDREWEAAHMVWLWADESPSMLYKSANALVSKQARALVLAFAMAELLARGGERLGWLGVTRPIVSRHAADKLAEALLAAPVQSSLPLATDLRNYADVILISDFLLPVEEYRSWIESIARQGARGHLVQIVDPAEWRFPYSGRVEFNDPETGQKLIAGNADVLSQGYGELFRQHVAALASLAKSLGWSHHVHYTDRVASEALIRLHMALSGETSGWR